jgi:hypothetical protein
MLEAASHKRRWVMQSKLGMAVGLAAAFALVAGCENLKPIGSRSSRSTGSSSTATRGGSGVKVEMYIMSKCPFGVQAVQGFKPVLDELGDGVDFHLDYIVTENNGQFGSLHGEPEVKGNLQQLCAMKNYPDIKKWMAFIDCQNKNWRTIPDGWEPCAAQTGMDKGRLRSCFEGSEGKDLLRESMKRANAAKAQGSPTILVGGAPYDGGRTKNDFLRAICTKMTTGKPAVCTKIPEDVEVNAVVLTDKRCKECQTAGLEANLKSRFFPKLKVKTLDYADAQGKTLYKQLGIQHLPIMLFEQGVEKAERYAQIERWMSPVSKDTKYKQLKIPAKFDPTAEICDNKTDDNNDGKVDCDDATCKEDVLCRKEIANKIDVFIMSQCPFGVQAVDAMKEVLDNFKGKIKFDVHYIADGNKAAFNSLHGQPEVDEDIRQLCVKKHYARNNKWLDYMWCRNKDYRSTDWKPCAKEGVVAAVVEKCATGDEGKGLLEEDIKIAKSLQVSGSPTWLANNKFKFSGIAANDIKNNICERNKGLAGCDKKLAEKANAPAGGGAGGSCGQ